MEWEVKEIRIGVIAFYKCGKKQKCNCRVDSNQFSHKHCSRTRFRRNPLIEQKKYIKVNE